MIQMRLTLLLAVAALSFVSAAAAMDRWAALSMIESGDNDRAIGPSGEVSRFQIQPVLWPGGNPRDTKAALIAAQDIMHHRADDFERSHKRVPTDFEFYILWNAPVQVNHPSNTVSERASRFVNLVKR